MRCSTACPAQHVQPAVRALACLCAGHMLPAAASVHLCPTSSPHSHHSNHPNPGLHPPSPGQVQVVQPVLLRGAAQQAAAVEPGHVGLLPQLWGARHAGLGQELPAGVGGQHGGLPREGGGGGWAGGRSGCGGDCKHAMSCGRERSPGEQGAVQRLRLLCSRRLGLECVVNWGADVG